MKKYLFNLAIACDQWLNALFGGDEDVCISSRLALNYPDSWGRKTVDWLFMVCFGHDNHCQASLAMEQAEKFNDDAVIK